MGLTKKMSPPSYLSEIPLEKRTQAQAWIVVVVIRPTHPGPSLDSGGGGGGGGDKADSPKKFPSPYHMSNPAEKKKSKSIARLAKLTAVVLAN